MKIELSQAELLWLNNLMGPYLALAAQRKADDGGALMRLVGKMKYKFTPNASYVSLAKKERELISDLVSHRLGMLEARGALTEETPFLAALKAKVSL